LRPVSILLPDDLKGVAKALLRDAEGWRIFAFYAEMGVGKTTFISAIAELLGVEERRSSPTYAIVNEYRNKEDKPLYHFDFYRINDLEEAYDIGCEDYFYSAHYCFIEWPERIEELLPEETVKVYMQKVGERREIYWELPH